MIAVIDNYDSFTYNLVQFLGEIVQEPPFSSGEYEIRVWRNDAIDVEALADLRPSHVIISPGPGSPDKDSGISNDVIRVLGETTPILGVCLGQQGRHWGQHVAHHFEADGRVEARGGDDRHGRPALEVVVEATGVVGLGDGGTQ